MACHCTDCRQMTSSAFSIGMPVLASGFSFSGDTKAYARPADSGNESCAHRCVNCGGWTHTTSSGRPDIVVVRPVTLDKSDWVRPIAQIFTRSSLSWTKLSVPLSYETGFTDSTALVTAFSGSGITPRG
ncbi:GFA family protein [Paraburkholderia bengalensis]